MNWPLKKSNVLRNEIVCTLGTILYFIIYDAYLKIGFEKKCKKANNMVKIIFVLAVVLVGL